MAVLYVRRYTASLGTYGTLHHGKHHLQREGLPHHRRARGQVVYSEPPATDHDARDRLVLRNGFVVPFGREPGPQVVRSYLPSVLSDRG